MHSRSSKGLIFVVARERYLKNKKNKKGPMRLILVFGVAGGFGSGNGGVLTPKP